MTARSDAENPEVRRLCPVHVAQQAKGAPAGIVVDRHLPNRWEDVKVWLVSAASG